MLGYVFYPPPFVSFCVFLFIIYCTDCYLFVLCSGLIISVSLLCTWYFYNWVALGYDFYPSCVVLFWIYLSIKHIFHFVSCPFSRFACVDVLCHTTTPVGICSLMEHVSSKLHWLLHPPPSQPHVPTLLAGTTLLRSYHHPCSSLLMFHIGTAGFLFGFWTFEDGTDMLSWKFHKRHNGPQERSCLMFCGRSLRCSVFFSS